MDGPASMVIFYFLSLIEKLFCKPYDIIALSAFPDPLWTFVCYIMMCLVFFFCCFFFFSDKALFQISFFFVVCIVDHGKRKKRQFFWFFCKKVESLHCGGATWEQSGIFWLLTQSLLGHRQKSSFPWSFFQGLRQRRRMCFLCFLKE